MLQMECIYEVWYFSFRERPQIELGVDTDTKMTIFVIMDHFVATTAHH